MADDAQQKPTDYPLPPGPKGLRRYLEVFAFRKDNRKFFTERYREYGPIFQTWFGGSVVCLVGPEAVTFLQNTEYFERADANGAPTGPMMNFNAVPLLGGNDHTVRKALVMKAVSHDALDAYLPLIENIIGRWLDRWHVRTEFGWLDEFEKMGTGLGNALLFGELTGSNDPYLEEAIRCYVAGMGSLGISFPFGTYKKGLRCRDKLLVVIDEAIALHRKAIGEGKPFPNIMTALIRAFDDDESLGDKILANEVLHLYFAAFTGVSLGLTAMCLALGQYRAVMQQARAEVMDQCPTGPLTMDNLDQLDYLRMMTMEARRVNPVLANTFLWRVKKAAVFNKYQVPEDWKALGGLYATMHIPETFDDPSVFDPERFSKTRSPGRPPNSYCPHGASSEKDLKAKTWYNGHRCGGEPFVDMLMKVVAVHLLREYTWTLLPQDLEYTTGTLFPVPRDGLQVHFRPLYTDS